MRKTRWVVERKRHTENGELLQVVEIYAPHEKLKVVKRENKQYSYNAESIRVDIKQ